MTTSFLVVGGVAAAILAVSLLVGDLLHIDGVAGDGPFALPVIAGFLGTLGFGGAIGAQLAPDPTGTKIILGLGVGTALAFPAAWLTGRLMRAIMNMQTDATPERADILGTTGTVITDIPDGGYGEVRLTVGGIPMKVRASSYAAQAAGTEVFVIAAESPTSVIVEPFSSLRRSG